MFLRMLTWLAAAALGVVIGAAAGWAMVNRDAAPSAVASGPWRTIELIGQRDVDPVARAWVARIGLLAMARTETVYYSARLDDDGRVLDDGCVYRLEGRDLPARWWSITLYAGDQYLARNGDDAYSVSAHSVVRKTDGAFEIWLAPERPAEAVNWLATRNGGAISLTARLYNPDASVLDDLSATPLPSIDRVRCSEEAP